jgi:hypothetical protein
MDASAGLIAVAVLVALLCLRRRRCPVHNGTDVTNGTYDAMRRAQDEFRREQNSLMIDLDIERKAQP